MDDEQLNSESTATSGLHRDPLRALPAVPGTRQSAAQHGAAAAAAARLALGFSDFAATAAL